MLLELDDAYRNYFYDRAARPKVNIHPAGSEAPWYAKIQKYSFMKKDSQPYPIRQLNQDDEAERAMYGGVELIDQNDIGGCGCFTDSHCEVEAWILFFIELLCIFFKSRSYTQINCTTKKKQS